MCRWDVSKLKGIVYCTFLMNLIDFFILHLTWAIFNHATQMTNTSCSPKCQCIVIFYVGGFHHTPKVAIMFPIHTLHLFYHVSYSMKGRKLKQDVSIKLLRQEGYLKFFEGIKIDVPNLTSTSQKLFHLS